MAEAKTPILLFGATGYIGGAVLARFLKHPNINNFEITAYVRSAEKAKALESQFGVKVVVGNHQESDKIVTAVENAHVVVQAAEADNVPLMEAILKGFRNRHGQTGDVPVLIYTSGTGTLADDARGEYATETVFSDTNVDQLKSIPPTAIHRNVELMAIGADEEGYVRSYIVSPSTVYSLANHALAAAGISNRRSIQMPLLIKAGLERKQAGVVGKGKAIWPDVHIEDLADLYIVLFDSIVSHPETTGHGWEGVYFAENGEYTWYQAARAVGDALVALRISSDPEPTTLTVEDFRAHFSFPQYPIDPVFIGYQLGTNVRCRADRARSIGWKPKYTTEDLLKSISAEVDFLIAYFTQA